MHLSPLSESFFSDRFDDAGSLDDAGSMGDRRRPTHGEAHRDGLLRGLALLVVLCILVGFGFISSAINSTDTEEGPSGEAFTHCAVADR